MIDDNNIGKYIYIYIFVSTYHYAFNEHILIIIKRSYVPAWLNKNHEYCMSV